MDRDNGGANESERFLSQLCRRTFLRLWSYPNVYRDQGRNCPNGDGKELCDLLVIFDEDVVIFSDKQIEFNLQKPLETSWSRWIKKAVLSSINQIKGAERWIKNFPEKIYLDKKCTKIIPPSLRDSSSKKFHRIAVAKGASPALGSHIGVEGRMGFSSRLCESDAPNNPFQFFPAFLDSGKTQFVHIFDDFSIEMVLNQLTTASDFINYLNERERFLLSNAVFFEDERDLLDLYLNNLGECLKHSLPDLSTDSALRDSRMIVLAPGGHAGKSDRVLKWEKINNYESIWDRIIDAMGVNEAHETWEFSTGINFDERTLALKIMASEDRISRHYLSELIIEFLRHSSVWGEKFRIAESPTKQGVCYVFHVVPFTKEWASYEDYREYRRKRALFYAVCLKARHPKFQKIVVYSRDPPGGGLSEDLTLFECIELLIEELAWAEDTIKQYGFFEDKTMRKSSFTIDV